MYYFFSEVSLVAISIFNFNFLRMFTLAKKKKKIKEKKTTKKKIVA